MGVNKELFVFDVKTGVTIRFDSRKEAKDLINVRSTTTISDALASGAIIKGRFIVREQRLKRTEKTKLYKEYWTSRRVKGEEWKKAPCGLLISNLGRAHNGERFLFPTMLNTRTVVVKKDKKLYNLTRLVCELFVVKRPLTKNEVAFRKGHYLEYSADMVYLGTWEEYRTRGIRANSRDVVLLNDDGTIKEYYLTVKEASEKNFISRGALCVALKKKRPCCGKMFRYMEAKDYNLL